MGKEGNPVPFSILKFVYGLETSSMYLMLRAQVVIPALGQSLLPLKSTLIAIREKEEGDG